jgi:hypothetical protein
LTSEKRGRITQRGPVGSQAGRTCLPHTPAESGILPGERIGLQVIRVGPHRQERRWGRGEASRGSASVPFDVRCARYLALQVGGGRLPTQNSEEPEIRESIAARLTELNAEIDSLRAARTALGGRRAPGSEAGGQTNGARNSQSRRISSAAGDGHGAAAAATADDGDGAGRSAVAASRKAAGRRRGGEARPRRRARSRSRRCRPASSS